MKATSIGDYVVPIRQFTRTKEGTYKASWHVRREKGEVVQKWCLTIEASTLEGWLGLRSMSLFSRMRDLRLTVAGDTTDITFEWVGDEHASDSDGPRELLGWNFRSVAEDKHLMGHTQVRLFIAND